MAGKSQQQQQLVCRPKLDDPDPNSQQQSFTRGEWQCTGFLGKQGSYSYDWELNDWGASVPGTNIDLIQISNGSNTGTLTLTGSAYQLNVLSLTSGNVTGPVNAFTDTSNSWTILSTEAGISGFDALEWTIDTTDFAAQNPSATGTWSLSLANGGNDLLLSYVVVPEPATLALAAFGLAGMGVALRRRACASGR